jgi:hypothetical protein
MVRVNKVGRAMTPVMAVLCVTLALPTAAQEDTDVRAKRPIVSRNAPPSPNATINLINLLVKQGTITEEQAAALIKQADDEAYVARQAVRNATARAESAEKTATTASEAVSPPGTKRVTYVPEIVKKQLREEIKQEVMQKAQNERWASPGALPEWVSRIRFYGDVRVRYDANFFPSGNDQLSAVDYNAINTGSPYDTIEDNAYAWPTHNATQDRHRARLRARLGLEADLFEGFWAGLRVATGESSSPVSFNQSLGGSGGNFSKYGIWLDRAFIRYSPWNDVNFHAGRFDNPFFNVSDLVFHRDLGFDGFAAQARYEVHPGITPFVVAGAFPIFNTAFNVGASIDFGDVFNPHVTKFPSHDKWMFGAQIGSRFQIMPEVEFTFGAAYFEFINERGRRSTPCFTLSAVDVCDTDLTRPSFAQKGNTYMALRDIIPLFDADGNPLPMYQFFGLASSFRNVMLSARLDLGHFHPIHVVLDGEYVRNIAWKYDEIAASVNNPLTNPLGTALRPCPTEDPCPFVYDGGPNGWLARLTVGHRELKARWDWNAFGGYKWLESDAVIDAFADSDFGLGGTNLKGYFVGTNVAFGPNVWAQARWMSANQIAGAPYAVDIFQFDLNGRF